MDELLVNVVTLGQLATDYGLPVVLSTVGMKTRGLAGELQRDWGRDGGHRARREKAAQA